MPDKTLDPAAKEEILMNERDILDGLLTLSRGKTSEENCKRIEIKRGKKLFLTFRIRPLSEDEIMSCSKSATKYAATKPGQARVPLETNQSLRRSFLVYTATVDEDRAKIWDNKKAQDHLNLLQGVDMIDAVLFAGEKDRIIDTIEEISGYSVAEAEETAKNS